MQCSYWKSSLTPSDGNEDYREPARLAWENIEELEPSPSVSLCRYRPVDGGVEAGYTGRTSSRLLEQCTYKKPRE